MSRAKTLLFLALALALAGCGAGKQPCRPGTAFLTVTFDGATSAADSVTVTINADGKTVGPKVLSRTGGGATETYEITFATYPAGRPFRIDILATLAGNTVGTGYVEGELLAGCSTLPLTVDPVAVTDAAIPDMAGFDAAPDTAKPGDLAGSDGTAPPDIRSDLSVAVGMCTTGQKQCSNNGVQSCMGNLMWGTPVACVDQTCIAGACVGVCAPGHAECSGNGVQTCMGDGMLSAAVACSGQTCCAGSCQGVCAPGGTRCNGLQNQVCGTCGAWQDSGAACGNACSPGASQCSGLQPQTCVATCCGGGAWQNNGAACSSACSPGATQCSGLQPQTCVATGCCGAGAWQNTGGACGNNCTPNASQCNGQQPQACVATCCGGGTWQNNGPICNGTSQSCQSGTCANCSGCTAVSGCTKGCAPNTSTCTSSCVPVAANSTSSNYTCAPGGCSGFTCTTPTNFAAWAVSCPVGTTLYSCDWVCVTGCSIGATPSATKTGSTCSMQISIPAGCGLNATYYMTAMCKGP